MAADLKEQGNTLFKEGDFLKAAAAYTKAIKQDPQSHVLYRYLLVVLFVHVACGPANSTEHHHNLTYHGQLSHANCHAFPAFFPLCCAPSNRSAALLKLNKHAKALSDAEECVKLDPTWDKGWMRKGMVLESQGQLQQVGPAWVRCSLLVSICSIWGVAQPGGATAVLHACVLSAVQAYALVWVGCRLPSAVMDTCSATAASTATGADTPRQSSPTMCHARWLPSDTMRMRLPPLVLTITPSLGTGLIDTAAPLCCCCMLCAGPGVFLEGQRSSRWPC